VGQGGFLPHGFTGLVMMMAIIMFSFGGLELVGITAAEADNPEQSIPKATNQVIYRILIFYVGSLAVLLSLLPWTRVTADTSPFVLIFHELGDTFVANALNVVVLTAALSVYNSCVYCNSRMLFGLAQQGNAPKALLSVDKRGVPVNTILVSAVVTALCVLINYLAPESAFGLLMALVVSALVINWAMISLAHMKFRRAKQQQGVVTRFPALLLPAGQLGLPAVYGGGAGDYADDPGHGDFRLPDPGMDCVLGVGYLFKQKSRRHHKSTIIHLINILCSALRMAGRALLSASHFPSIAFIHIVNRSCNALSIPANNSLHTATERSQMAGNKLSVKEKIGYGMGDAGCNIIFGAIMLFVNYFYTDIFGLAPRWWAYCCCPYASLMP
jgi:aromatic amino acid transport protein AroP